jgi:hypothetical protein
MLARLRTTSPRTLVRFAFTGSLTGLTLFSYAVVALSLAVLPGLLDLPVLIVYYATIACMSVVTFTVLQGLIFHPPDTGSGRRQRSASHVRR